MTKSYEKDFEFTKFDLINEASLKILDRNLTVNETINYSKDPDNHVKVHSIIQSNESINLLKDKLMGNKEINKKYAIQLSGHMRHLKLHLWKQFLDAHRDKVDIFIHTWTGSGKRNKNNNSWVCDTQNCDINLTEIINVFKPKKILVENATEYFDSFSIYGQDKQLEVYYNANPIYNQNSDFSRFIVSQLYSIYKSNCLRVDYEKLKKVKYDLVFRVRADTFVDLNFKELSKLKSNNILFVNSETHHHALQGRGCAACIYEYPNKVHKDHANLICDIFYYGSPEVMNKVSSIYLNILKLLKDMESYNKKQIETGKYNQYLVKHKYTGYGVNTLLAEDKYFKCIYPERLIIEFMKDEFILTDPLRHFVEYIIH